MIVFEYFFTEFNTRGNDEYLNSWALHIGNMADAGGKS
jgi:hypothetical protein